MGVERKIRKYARLVKETRNGQMHESDAVVFDKLLKYYEEHITPESREPKGTYPSKS